MKTLIFAGMLALVAVGAQKGDPWEKMPVSSMVEDRRDEVKMRVMNVKLYWDGVDATGLLRKGVDSIVPVTWRPRDRG